LKAASRRRLAVGIDPFHHPPGRARRRGLRAGGNSAMMASACAFISRLK